MERGKGSIALCFHVNGRYGPASIADCQENLSGLSLRRDSILVGFRTSHSQASRERGRRLQRYPTCCLHYKRICLDYIRCLSSHLIIPMQQAPSSFLSSCRLLHRSHPPPHPLPLSHHYSPKRAHSWAPYFPTRS